LAMIRSILEKDKLSKEEISQLAKGSLKKKVDLLEKGSDPLIGLSFMKWVSQQLLHTPNMVD
jgi:hypothetical protein